jgi:hypothetical protein
MSFSVSSVSSVVDQGSLGRVGALGPQLCSTNTSPDTALKFSPPLAHPSTTEPRSFTSSFAFDE